MKHELGPQYKFDNQFKADARLHQSRYRAEVLQVEYSEYGNRLTESDGEKLLNYYDRLAVRDALRKRFPRFSKNRDTDMLRSEHIPFNLLAPLVDRPDLLQSVLKDALGIRLEGPFTAKFEWAPAPASKYLDDKTSFDMYIQGFGPGGKSVGVGIEVKYTEKGYPAGPKEAAFIRDPKSTYWTVTRKSDRFNNCDDARLIQNDLRQIWRNHLLGLSMIQKGDVSDFVSVTLYPSGNEHFTTALRDYKGLLKDQGDRSVCGCTYEKFIACLNGDAQIKHWRDYLIKRYLVK